MIGMRIGKMGEEQKGMISLISEVEKYGCSLSKKERLICREENVITDLCMWNCTSGCLNQPN